MGAGACACAGTPCADASCGCGCHTPPDWVGNPGITAKAGGRTVTRTVEPRPEPDPDDEDPWDGERYITCTGEKMTEKIYAPALSGQPVTFTWHGAPGDTVLNWTVGGGSRFSRDGQDAGSVLYAADAADVVPAGSAGACTVTAKCLTQQKSTVTRTAALTLVGIAAEPVFSSGATGMPPNPSGFFAGGAASFTASFSPNLDAADIHWRVEGESAALALAVDATAPQTLFGLAPGGGALVADIDRFMGPPPKFSFTVHQEEPPSIPVHFMFIRDPFSGDHAGSETDLPGLIDGVNVIYRQTGIRFHCASVAYTNESLWYLGSSLPQHQLAIVNSRRGTQGLEVYIVPMLAGHDLGMNWKGRGLLITGTSDVHVLAHEIGHECDWNDVYTNPDDKSAPQFDMTTELSVKHLSPADLAGGPSPRGYYEPGRKLAAVIRRCLMFGRSSGGNDIPSGSVTGYDTQGNLGPVNTGMLQMNRTPKHDL
jgi:hypothetical protein